MKNIQPEFVSPDRQQFVFAMNTNESTVYVCSSTKLRNAINQTLKENEVTNESAMYFKETANAIIKSIKEITGQEIDTITLTNGNGKYLTISQKSFEHNFEPTHEIALDPETVTRRAESKERRSAFPTNNEKRNQETIRMKQAEIRTRLQKLADKYHD
ncbi:MAG: hypothetical protein HQ591_08900 [candidate division Zixibacteria bacterium]|nr:hypothetical protein [Candidatus Tariuqbacter arcticus]